MGGGDQGPHSGQDKVQVKRARIKVSKDPNKYSETTLGKARQGPAYRDPLLHADHGIC